MTSTTTAASIPASVVPSPPIPASPVTVTHDAHPSFLFACTANSLIGTSSLKIVSDTGKKHTWRVSWMPRTPNQGCWLHLENRFMQITVKF